MRYHDPSDNATTYMALGLLGQLGLAVALPIVVGAWLGHYLDTRFGTRGLFLLGLLFIGLFAGGYEAWMLISRILRTQEAAEEKDWDSKE